VRELPLTLAEIHTLLAGIEGYKPTDIRKMYFDEEGGPEGRLIFKVEFEPGEHVMTRGEYSDYVAVHLQGLLRVCDLDRPAADLPECWSNPRPWQRRLASVPVLGRMLSYLFPAAHRESGISAPGKEEHGEQLLSRPELERLTATISTRDAASGAVKNVTERFQGVPSVLFKRKRTKTLVADQENDQPCQVLLIKRRVLLDLLFKPAGGKLAPTRFYQGKIADWVERTIPEVLSANRAFRSILYVEDVTGWKQLREKLDSGQGPGLVALREQVGPILEQWPATESEPPSDMLQYEIVNALNGILQKDDLLDQHAWAREVLDEAALRTLEEDSLPQTSNQICYRNRLVVDALLSGALESIEKFPFRRPADFKGEVAKRVCEHLSTALPEQVNKGQVIFQQGDPADALYLVLQGTFRISLPGPRGDQVYNHIQTDGFFGEACIMDDGPDGPPRRSAKVEALSRGVLLRLERPLMRDLCQRFPELKDRFVRERKRMQRRDRARSAGWRVPPQDPPLDIATRLQVTTNLLVIDMDRCTRCDQCVQACGAAHEDRPRFHRSNPELRFGKWEVAGACLHCSDAPCLEECPVGAITFLDTGAVQIHRNRCIGCAKCASACPFGVIDMYKPVDNNPVDCASLQKNKNAVATKCDLCLTTERQPPCVAACPYGAAFRGPPDTFFPGIRDWEALTSAE